MKKELKDYIHFHLGCECKTASEKVGKLVSVGISGAMIHCPNEEPAVYFISNSAFKPILRPLSDITQEECAGLGWAYKHEDGRKIMHSCEYSHPVEMKYLLSKDFDIFGLIEAGIAIDKTKM